jgi:hypothetical protein
VNDQIEPLRTEESFERVAVADIQIVISEVLCYATQTVEIPAGVARITKKDTAHIIVYAVDLVALVIEVFHGFRANQPAGSRNKNGLRLHLNGLTIL